jgi:hypothetical protein
VVHAQVVTATIAATTECSNGVDDTPGLGLICDVTVANTFTGTGGSATVTVYECHGPAGAPKTACTTTTTSLTEPVTAVTQCNSSTNGGGATLRCSVTLNNNFVGVSSTATAATVNQCVGTGGAGNVLFACNPYPANTTGAAIIQCNGSATGGGASVTCSATGTMASAGVVKINQCNGSANGGGSLIVCSANVVNRVNGVVVGVGGGTAPPTSMVASGSTSNSSTPPFALLISLALAGLGLAVVLNRRRSALN